MLKACVVLLVALMIASCAKRPTETQVAAAKTPVQGDAARGRQLLAAYGCTGCHIIPGVEGPAGSLGPPLQSVGSRPSINLKVENTPQNMTQWIMDPRALDPDSTMPQSGATPSEAADMTAYLFSLK